MLVKDLVWLDEEGKFRNDVQLSHYEDKKINQSLIGCYIFSYDAPRGYLSSANLLKSIIHAYVNPHAHKNRTVVIGQYGHGKSHLALVLANYFGKPYDSKEFNTVINRIQRAIDQPAQLEIYKEFRNNRPEFLIIRLNGDNPKSLREQFMQSLEKGLKEHEATKNAELPFWQKTAKRLLNSLEGHDLEKANQFLEQFGNEVAILTQEVEAYSDQTYPLIIELFTHLHGVAPNLGGETSMKEILNWVGKEYCGGEKPLGGICVLFDEFSLFIQNQSRRGGSGELQDLLNGVQDQSGKAVFIGFSQHDPKIIARSVLQGAGLDNLEKELNRIEGELILYSLMESVIDAYLTQSDNHWAELRSDSKVRGPLARASNLCMEVFNKRYEDTLRWTPEKFDEIVQKGCFPLHPITTAVLCDIQLQVVQKAGNPRTVLGFVERMVRERANEPVQRENGRLNWVHAIELIDYFYDYLPEAPKLLYETATQNLTTESPVEFDGLLKALLLEEIIKIRRDSRIQVEFLAEVAGLEFQVALENLKLLAKANITRYDPISRLNSFMPAMSDPNRMQDLLNEKRNDFIWDWSQLLKMNKLPAFDSINVEVKWGHPQDWAASQYIIIPECLDEKHLKEISNSFTIDANGFNEGNRGVVVWLLARSAEEVNELRINVNKIIDLTFVDEYPLPVLIIIPDKPNPELLDAYETKLSLDTFSNEERQEVGQAVYQIYLTRANQALKEGIKSLRGDERLYKTSFRHPLSISAPKTYRAVLHSRGNISLTEALSLAYELAYRGAPPEFFTQYKVNQSTLRNAVKTISPVLIKNKLSTSRDMLQTQPVAKDLCDKFLVKSWGVLARDYSIQEPANSRILESWSLLDSKITIGAKDIQLKSLIEDMVNPPFGFDYNTVILLVCSWLGFNCLEVKFTINGVLNSTDEIAEIMTNAKSIKEFLEAVSVRNILSISRINLGDVINEVKSQVERAQRDSFSQEEANKLIQELEAHSQNQSISAEIRSQASNAAEYLKSSLEKAKEYDSKANEISNIINSKKVNELLGVPNLLEKLPVLGSVKISSPSADVIRNSWHKQLSESVNNYCQEYESAKELTVIGRNQDVLTKGKKEIKRVAPDLADRFDRALENLKIDEQHLRAKNLEAPIKAEIETMKTSLPYIELIAYKKRLKTMADLSDETMQLRDKKLSSINTAISQLESFAQLLIDSAADLSSQDDIENWKTQYLQSQKLLEGSQFQKELDKKIELVNQICELLINLEQIKRLPLNSPNEIGYASRQLDEFEKVNSPWINVSIKNLINLERTRIEKIKKSHEEEALVWAKNIRKFSEEGDFQSVILKSRHRPPFLSEKENETIEIIVLKAENEVEKDIVTKIEFEFRQIRDKTLQHNCIERLQMIVTEKNSVTK